MRMYRDGLPLINMCMTWIVDAYLSWWTTITSVLPAIGPYVNAMHVHLCWMAHTRCVACCLTFVALLQDILMHFVWMYIRLTSSHASFGPLWQRFCFCVLLCLLFLCLLFLCLCFVLFWGRECFDYKTKSEVKTGQSHLGLIINISFSTILHVYMSRHGQVPWCHKLALG